MLVSDTDFPHFIDRDTRIHVIKPSLSSRANPSAGFHGLAAAKQLHCTQPGCKLVVYDGQSTVGGKWAENRLFPGLKSNCLLGTYEYPDFPMSPDRFNVKPGQHIRGEVISTYLEAYAKEFGIIDFIKLGTTVVSAEHQDAEEKGGWVLTIQPPNQGPQVKVLARRLVAATGILSEPFMPKFDGQDQFGGRIFHSMLFPKNLDTLKAKSVTVFGAGKSGWDAVYQYATAGVKVNWVIRCMFLLGNSFVMSGTNRTIASGHGPCWMSPPYVTPFNKWIEKLASKFPNMTPSITPSSILV